MRIRLASAHAQKDGIRRCLSRIEYNIINFTFVCTVEQLVFGALKPVL